MCEHECVCTRALSRKPCVGVREADIESSGYQYENSLLRDVAKWRRALGALKLKVDVSVETMKVVDSCRQWKATTPRVRTSVRPHGVAPSQDPRCLGKSSDPNPLTFGGLELHFGSDLRSRECNSGVSRIGPPKKEIILKFRPSL
jgi:hypothetical protein